MKRLFLTLAVVFCGVTAFSQDFSERRVIEVTVTADTLVAPNKIDLRVVIQSDKGAGKKGFDEAENRLLTLLKNNGIDTIKDVEILGFSSTHKYKGNSMLVYRTYNVVANDMKQVSKIMGEAIEKKIGNISISAIYNTDYEKYLVTLSERALKQAKAKAEFQAGVLGEKIWRVAYVSQGYSRGGVENFRLMQHASKASDNSYETEVGIKDIKISTSFTVKFELF